MAVCIHSDNFYSFFFLPSLLAILKCYKLFSIPAPFHFIPSLHFPSPLWSRPIQLLSVMFHHTTLSPNSCLSLHLSHFPIQFFLLHEIYYPESDDSIGGRQLIIFSSFPSIHWINCIMLYLFSITFPSPPWIWVQHSAPCVWSTVEEAHRVI